MRFKFGSLLKIRHIFNNRLLTSSPIKHWDALNSLSSWLVQLFWKPVVLLLGTVRVAASGVFGTSG